MHESPSRHRAYRKTIWMVLITAFILFAGVIALGLWHSAELRNIFSGQFNDEQQVIAQNISRLIERELDFLEKEIRLLRSEVAANPFSPEALQPGIQKSLARISESGVRKIMITDPGKNTEEAAIHHYTTGDHWVLPGSEMNWPASFPDPGALSKETVWFSRPKPDRPNITMFMAAALPADKGLIVFDINVSWLLSPFLKDIRSGKTGYAWIICDQGYFLYHPENDFIGRDAFDVRQQKDPRISFHTINFIQQEKMLKGLEGTGHYESGWHRGMTGRIEKLIAYTPIRISDAFPQRWSIAVVAPVAEIEGLVRDAQNRQMLIQVLILTAIAASASAVLLFEKRWSRYLEQEVNERTQALSRSEEKYRSLVESAEDFIFTVDPNGYLMSVNSFAAAFFGKTPEECLKKPLSTLFPRHAAKKMSQLAGRVFRGKRSVQDTFDIAEKDRLTWINANFMPLKDKKGSVGAVLCIARDVTEQKNLESRLINAEKLASMGTLAAGVAHEINNPIGVILGFSDLLLQDAEPDSQAWEDLKTIERQGMHCKQIVENLLSFARHGRESTEYADLAECIDEVIKITRHTLEMNDIETDIRMPDHLPLVNGDFRQLQQVFLNLVNNSMAAMPAGGKLVLSGSVDETNRRVIITVSDTGTGIPETDLSHIFEPFYTTKAEGEGTGLGLFVSYGIINRYGGMIECTSRTPEASDNPGTTFTITLLQAPERMDHE